MDINKLITTDSKEFKKLVSDISEIKSLLQTVVSSKKINISNTPTIKEEYISVDAMALLIKKSRITVNNYCKEYEEIIRRKPDPLDSRFNLIHQKDFQKAFEKGRKIPFNREVFNKKKAA